MELIDKKILLICPNFFSYHKKIIMNLEASGASVNYIEDRPFTSFFMRAMTSLSPYIVSRALEIYYIKKIKKNKNLDYDFIFVVNGQTISKTVLSYLKETQANSKFILYLWDSILNRPNIVKNFVFFEEVYTFDEEDSIKFGIKFRPLFYLKDFKPSQKEKNNIDLSFVGSIHSDRYKIIKKIKQNYSKKYKFYFYMYIQAKWVFLIYKYLMPSMEIRNHNDFSFSQLSVEEVQRIFEDSSCILDIEHPNQTGLTIRTMEAVFSGKKLITTNFRIKNYDFYNEANIFILDREKPIIPNNFLNTKFEDMSSSIRHKYSIDGWIQDLLFNREYEL
jgi:hypothetical protein